MKKIIIFSVCSLILASCGGKNINGIESETEKDFAKLGAGKPVFNLQLADLEFSGENITISSPSGVYVNYDEIRNDCLGYAPRMINHIKQSNIFANGESDKRVTIVVEPSIVVTRPGLIQRQVKGTTIFSIKSAQTVLGQYKVLAEAVKSTVEDRTSCSIILNRSLRKWFMLVRNKYQKTNYNLAKVDEEVKGDTSVGDSVFMGAMTPVVVMFKGASAVGNGLLSIAEVMHENPKLIQSLNSTIQQTRNQLNQNNTKTQQLYAQSSEQQRQAQARHDNSPRAKMYREGADRSAANKKRLAAGHQNQTTQSSLSSYNDDIQGTSRSKTNASVSASNIQPNTAGSSNYMAPEVLFDGVVQCPNQNPPLYNLKVGNTHPLSLNMTCPAYYQCLWDNTEWGYSNSGKALPKSWGWRAKKPANSSACTSYKVSCIEKKRRRAWGANYDKCLAWWNNSQRSSESGGSIGK